MSVRFGTVGRIRTNACGSSKYTSFAFIRLLTKSIRHHNCAGKSYDNQVDADLSDGNGFFHDRISSWRCGFK
jgi:hypothetical protein